MTAHAEQHPLSGQTVTLGEQAGDPVRGVVVPGATFVIEDWWDRVAGRSWMTSDGNPAALQYAMRTGFRGIGAVPLDDEVVYGKIAGRGHLVHAAELPS